VKAQNKNLKSLSFKTEHSSKFLSFKREDDTLGAMTIKTDKIFIKELRIPCLIGIFDWERKKKQIVSVDLEFPSPIEKAARSDKIQDAIDYKKIAKRTIDYVGSSKFYLIEALIENLAQILLKEFKLKEITLQIEKPGAIRGARTVGIRITRKSKRR